MKTTTEIIERPMLYSSPMVRAILEDRKGMTRRMVKPAHLDGIETDDAGNFSFMHAPNCGGYCDYACAAAGEVLDGHIGWTPWGSSPKHWGRLWVRESCWLRPTKSEAGRCVKYVADDCDKEWCKGHGWKFAPSIHMPRWASRITLEITGVRVERLQQITTEDAINEGVQYPVSPRGGALIRVTGKCPPCHYHRAINMPAGETLTHDELMRAHFASLWDTINGKGSWDANHWVWAISFRRVEVPQ